MELLKPYEGLAINYKKLCEILGWEYIGGNKKKARINELSCYCDFEKIGTKFFIKKVYDGIMPKQNKKEKYTGYIEAILLNLLNEREDKSIITTKQELMVLLSMINNNFLYTNSKENRVKIARNIGYNYDDFTNDLSIQKSQLYEILNYTLNKLDEGIINIKPLYAYKLDEVNGTFYAEYDSDAGKIFQEIEVEAKSITGYCGIFSSQEVTEHYRRECKSFLKENFPVATSFWHCIKIISTEKIIANRIEKTKEFNEKIKEKLLNSKDKRIKILDDKTRENIIDDIISTHPKNDYTKIVEAEKLEDEKMKEIEKKILGNTVQYYIHKIPKKAFKRKAIITKLNALQWQKQNDKSIWETATQQQRDILLDARMLTEPEQPC